MNFYSPGLAQLDLVRSRRASRGCSESWSAARGPESGVTYSGYTVFAGELEYDGLAADPACGYKVYIGTKKYFVTSDVGDGRVQWYSFLAQPPGTKRAGDSWEGGASTDAMHSLRFCRCTNQDHHNTHVFIYFQEF